MSDTTFLKYIQRTEYIMDIEKLIELCKKILPLFTSDLKKTYGIFDEEKSQSAFIYIIALFVYYSNVLSFNETERAIKDFIYAAFKKDITVEELRGLFMQNPDFDKFVDQKAIMDSLSYLYFTLIQPNHSGLEENYKTFFAEYILRSIRNALPKLQYPLELANVYVLTIVEELEKTETSTEDLVLKDLENKFDVMQSGNTTQISSRTYFTSSDSITHPNLKNQTIENLLKYVIPIIQHKLNDRFPFIETGRLLTEVVQHIVDSRNAPWRGIKSIDVELVEMNHGDIEITVEVSLKLDSDKLTAYVQYAQVNPRGNVVKSGIKQITSNAKFVKWKSEERSSFNEG